MARGGKKASASEGGASPAPLHAAAAKKRKSEALLKDLLGNTQDDGLVRSPARAHALHEARAFRLSRVARAA